MQPFSISSFVRMCTSAFLKEPCFFSPYYKYLLIRHWIEFGTLSPSSMLTQSNILCLKNRLVSFTDRPTYARYSCSLRIRLTIFWRMRDYSEVIAILYIYFNRIILSINKIGQLQLILLGQFASFAAGISHSLSGSKDTSFHFRAERNAKILRRNWRGRCVYRRVDRLVCSKGASDIWRIGRLSG